MRPALSTPRPHSHMPAASGARKAMRLGLPHGVCLALLLSAGLVHAQRYTAKVLTPPSGTLGGCELAAHHPLDASGQVRGTCTFWTGGLYFYNNIPLPESRARVVTWKADGSRTSGPYPTGASVWNLWGQGADGLTYADLVATPVRDYPSLKRLGTYTFNGSKWVAWQPPAPLAGKWQLANMSPQGSLVLKATEAGQAGQLAWVNGSTVNRLPSVPLASAGYSAHIAWPNDKGQVLVRMTSADTQAPIRWLWWNGQQWQERQMAGLGSTPVDTPSVQGLNNQGQALVITRDVIGADIGASPHRYQLWSLATDQLTTLPTNLIYEGRGQINDTGVVTGENLPADATREAYFKPRRATVWRQGQSVDLNTLTTVPTGGVLRRTLGLNAKGQILAEMEKTDASTSWVLLTPQ